jgi:hypothetical protein
MPRGYPAIMSVYKGRGAEWFGSEVPVMFEWMSRKRRPGPAAALDIDPKSTPLPWQAFRPTDNRFYWIGVNNIVERRVYDPQSPARVPATVRGDIKGNRIDVLETSGATQLTLWLSRDLIDWTRPLIVTVRGGNAPLSVSINGSAPSKWKSQVIEPSLEVLLNDFAERGDRRMLYLQKLAFPISP